MAKYLPVEEANDDCTGQVCTCDDDDDTWYIQQGRAALAVASSGVGISPGFGLHLVNLTKRATTGGLSVAEVEAHFASKMKGMKRYDSFMDYSIGLYASSLDAYTDAFDADGVDYLALSWTADDGTPWYSAIVLVPGTHMVLELMSDSAASLAAKPAGALARAEPRLSAEQSGQ